MFVKLRIFYRERDVHNKRMEMRLIFNIPFLAFTFPQFYEKYKITFERQNLLRKF